MKVKIVLSIAVLALGLMAATEAQGQQVITSVVRANGASGDRPPIGAFNGNTQCLPMEAGGVKDGNLIRSDRDAHRFVNTPTGTLGPLNKPLIGSEYVRTFNNDKDAGGVNVTYTVTISMPATVWITMDDRWGEADRQTRVNSATSFVPAGTFKDTGLNVSVGGDNNNPMSVYAADLGPGTYVFGPQQGNNFYTIGAVPGDPTSNPAPVVDAGPDQSIYITESAQLNGTVTDEPPLEGDPGVLSWYWYKVSGPGTVNFSNIHALDATVTFTAKGTYELMLQATDGDKDANDLIVVRVKDRADELLVGYWNFEDNVQDQSMNSNHGTIVALNGGGTYDADAAIGTKAMNLMKADIEDPNTNYVDLGAAPELNFGTGSWTVTGWFKTAQTGTDDANKGNIFSNGGDNTGGIRYTLGINEVTAGAISVTTDDDVAKVQATSAAGLNDDRWHFAAGVRDGGVIRVYVDGVLQGTTALPAGYNLSGTSQTNSYIGVGVNFANGPAAVYKHLNGLVDDVRVYNYALALEDEPQYDSIRSLTAMGPLLAKVDAGANINFNWKPTLKTQLNGQITDLGRPSETTIVWSTEQGPGDAEAAFDDPGSLDTLVGFPRSGVYTLKLAVYDEGVWVDDTVQVTVNAPTCANVIADGLLLVTDLDGDCYVGLSDLAILLANWAQCNDPADVHCTWPF
ncbi:MAG: LamG domain-containing protein [Phycisphaerae bacterium]|nr:LamG domain-containing protein [Phycisphaerae bacterium]